MKRIFYLLSCICFLYGQAQGQLQLTPTVLASSGGDTGTGNLKLHWTLGETMVDAYASNTLQLGQGFHQGYLGVITSIYEAPDMDFDIRVFPNPASHELFLQTDSPEPLAFELLDLTGRTVRLQSLTGSEGRMDISTLPGALYLMRVVSRNGILLKTLKIVKSDY